jgi:hypothetical protein
MLKAISNLRYVHFRALGYSNVMAERTTEVAATVAPINQSGKHCKQRQ